MPSGCLLQPKRETSCSFARRPDRPYAIRRGRLEEGRGRENFAFALLPTSYGGRDDAKTYITPCTVLIRTTFDAARRQWQCDTYGANAAAAAATARTVASTRRRES